MELRDFSGLNEALEKEIIQCNVKETRNIPSTIVPVLCENMFECRRREVFTHL